MTNKYKRSIKIRPENWIMKPFLRANQYYQADGQGRISIIRPTVRVLLYDNLEAAGTDGDDIESVAERNEIFTRGNEGCYPCAGG